MGTGRDGIRGGGRPGVARAGGGPPGPGRLGIAGAGRPPVGTGGGARELERGGGCVTPRLGPPGDGGDNPRLFQRCSSVRGKSRQYKIERYRIS